MLRECLLEGPMKRKEILAEAKELGISASTIDRAKIKLGVQSGGERNLKLRTWSLPSTVDEDTGQPIPRQVVARGENGRASLFGGAKGGRRGAEDPATEDLKQPPIP